MTVRIGNNRSTSPLGIRGWNQEGLWIVPQCSDHRVNRRDSESDPSAEGCPDARTSAVSLRVRIRRERKWKGTDQTPAAKA